MSAVEEAFLAAVIEGDDFEVSRLLDGNALLLHVRTGDDVEGRGLPKGSTPLHLAVRYGHSALVEALIAAGSPLDVRNAEGRTPLHDALVFDRARAYGMRLDIPAGTAVRFEPGETKTVNLVAIAGNRVISGGNAFANGPVSEETRNQLR